MQCNLRCDCNINTVPYIKTLFFQFWLSCVCWISQLCTINFNIVLVSSLHLQVFKLEPFFVTLYNVSNIAIWSVVMNILFQAITSKSNQFWVIFYATLISICKILMLQWLFSSNWCTIPLPKDHQYSLKSSIHW